MAAQDAIEAIKAAIALNYPEFKGTKRKATAAPSRELVEYERDLLKEEPAEFAWYKAKTSAARFIANRFASLDMAASKPNLAMKSLGILIYTYFENSDKTVLNYVRNAKAHSVILEADRIINLFKKDDRDNISLASNVMINLRHMHYDAVSALNYAVELEDAQKRGDKNAFLSLLDVDKEYFYKIIEDIVRSSSSHVPEDAASALIVKLKATFDLAAEDRKSRSNLSADISPIGDMNDYATGIVIRAVQDEKFAKTLSMAFAEAGFMLPLAHRKTQPAATTIADNIPFWKDRSKDDHRNPIEFIKDNYGEFRDGKWHHAGLTRPDLRRDAELYAAYAQWIKKDRHPEDALEFAPGGKKSGRPPMEDPVAAIERVRQRARIAAAKNQPRKTI